MLKKRNTIEQAVLQCFQIYSFILMALYKHDTFLLFLWLYCISESYQSCHKLLLYSYCCLITLKKRTKYSTNIWQVNDFAWIYQATQNCTGKEKNSSASYIYIFHYKKHYLFRQLGAWGKNKIFIWMIFLNYSIYKEK